MNGRALGVDPGTKRIGLALSDPLGVTAQPIGHLDCVGSRRDLDNIADRAREHDVRTVVIGLPLTLAGEEGPASAAARRIAEGLERRLPGVRIELWDERLTTAQAERTMIDGMQRRAKRRKKIDSLAATLILQSWLDARAYERTESD
ncbi:MAG: Holliday junction resolvase RuvX [Acidobacteria bacterium]|nr:Holliday junction resolvase RuvX [Acidobacteriota bacterium]NIM60533.1 Holliday junction resolvase RuvX [Acidobacteriota bacterium]NIO59504.1 Holliday junction resolvase RuvX [Acidobacteriota bacterium]NIQ30533.1 Holliday junction resolvase RuvX [Acidobacteriota bacterium]NIQ85481.1 Holliday junction resolvase RuvX [Acidobacteriota bacterium]